MTVAEGAEQAYSRSGNAARTETAAEARANDVAMRAAWARHPLVHTVRTTAVVLQLRAVCLLHFQTIRRLELTRD